MLPKHRTPYGSTPIEITTEVSMQHHETGSIFIFARIAIKSSCVRISNGPRAGLSFHLLPQLFASLALAPGYQS